MIWSILWGHLYAALEHADCISFLNHPYITLNSLLLVFPSGSFLVAKLCFAAQVAFFHYDLFCSVVSKYQDQLRVCHSTIENVGLSHL